MKYLHLVSIVALLAVGSPSLLAQDTSCGIAWGPALNLSGDNPYTYAPQVATQGETLHVTWEGGGYRLPYRRSVNGGLTWEPVREMIADTSVTRAHFPWVVADSRFVYLIFTKTSPQGSSPACFLKSSDRGSTWSPEDLISNEIAGSVRNVFLRGDTVVVQFPRPSPHNTYCMFRTIDGGVTWDTSLVPVRGQVVVGGGAFHNARGGVVVGHGQEISYKRSLNLGNSWQDSVVLSALDDQWSNDAKIAISDDSLPVVYVMWRDAKYGCSTLVGCSIILRTSYDGGLSWGDEYMMTDAPVGYTWELGTEIGSSGNNVVAVWTNDQTGHINMRYSINQGDSWSELCDVTPGGTTTDPSCAITPTSIHVVWEDFRAGGWNIWYRRGVILANSIVPWPTQPTEFSMSQNYPNPFNGQTRIEYTLKDGAVGYWTILKIFDLLGQQVAELVNEEQGPGRRTVSWDATGISSGVYISRLSVFEGGVRTRALSRTMMLIK